MSLRPEEIDRIKWELGVSVNRLGAEPYISYVAVFDRAIQPYLFDNTTTSATSVSAGGGQTTITLAANPTAASGNGLTFQAGTSVLIDVGPSQEQSVIQAITGLSVTLTLANAHSGTYVVAPVGSEQIVREVLSRLDAIKSELLNIAPKTAGVESVDEVKLYPSGGKGRGGKMRDKFESLIQQREQARDDLGEAVGYPNLRRMKRGTGFSFEVY
jgi:hypothetical protein